MNLSLFFPAFNEGNGIEHVVEQALDTVEELAIPHYEIIIIEDGSTDNTGQITDTLAANHPHVHVIHHPYNLGYGASLKDGFINAKYDWIFYSDGDNQFKIQELEKLAELISDNTVVIGYRHNKQYSPTRKVSSYCYNKLVSILFGLKVKDVNCAFKLVPKKLINQIEISSQHGFIDAELLIKAKQIGFNIEQIEVTNIPRKHGTASGGSPTMIAKTILETISFWSQQRKKS